MHMIPIRTYLQKFHLVALLKLKVYLPKCFINFCIKHNPPILRRKNKMINQNTNIVAFVDIFAHLYSLRRKRRGIYP